ncbi:MAG: 30S ribosomal protein S27ae [archaeon]
MPKKQKERAGKKQRKKHPKHLKSTLYETKGGSLERKRRSCPKCGPGVLMAEHKNRLNCGKCGYTEFKEKKAVE